jgi:hypothetical protein
MDSLRPYDGNDGVPAQLPPSYSVREFPLRLWVSFGTPERTPGHSELYH